MLALKMKELEMMDLTNLYRSLDVEETLHYYLRLTASITPNLHNRSTSRNTTFQEEKKTIL